MTQTFSALALAALLTLGAQTADARGEGRAMLPSFEQIDAAGSGAITLQDFQAYFQANATQRQDQAITKLMEHADADGKLDADALRKGLDAMREERRANMGQHGRDGADRKGRGDRTEMGARMFERMDANNDDKVDAAEYAAFAERMNEMCEHRGRGWRN